MIKTAVIKKGKTPSLFSNKKVDTNDVVDVPCNKQETKRAIKYASACKEIKTQLLNITKTS